MSARAGTVSGTSRSVRAPRKYESNCFQTTMALAEGKICKALATRKQDVLLSVYFFFFTHGICLKNENLFLRIYPLILGSLQILFFFPPSI